MHRVLASGHPALLDGSSKRATTLCVPWKTVRLEHFLACQVEAEHEADPLDLLVRVEASVRLGFLRSVYFRHRAGRDPVRPAWIPVTFPALISASRAVAHAIASALLDFVFDSRMPWIAIYARQPVLTHLNPC